MTSTDILKLIDAGFTKDEIIKLDADVKVVPTKTPEATQTDPAEIETVPAPVPDTKPETTPSGVTLSDDQFKTLLQQLNVKGASLDVPPESDIKTKLAEHFKEVTIGK